MNRLLAAAAALLVAAPLLVACASEDAPAQQDGVAKYERKMTQAEAQKLMDDMNQAGPRCRRAASDCSYSAPDADGLVVFEALVSCTANDACPILQAQTGCN